MGKNDGLYMLLAGGVALYMYNTNADFKTRVDQFISQLKGQQAQASTDSGTTTVTDDSNTGTTTTTTTPDTQIIPIVIGGTENAALCKSQYGGSCTGECANGYGTDICKACLSTCGALATLSSRFQKKQQNSNNQQKKENRTSGNSSKSKPPDNKTPIPKSKGDPSTSPFNTNKIPKCPARCEPFRLSSPATYQTCCKGK